MKWVGILYIKFWMKSMPQGCENELNFCKFVCDQAMGVKNEMIVGFIMTDQSSIMIGQLVTFKCFFNVYLLFHMYFLLMGENKHLTFNLDVIINNFSSKFLHCYNFS
jgi:hypothetical protein